ncbi:hypothetical protein MMC11_002619 [Xylographa trunciseda]|nr:hypothetical protein [Xylographa trunciseda]
MDSLTQLESHSNELATAVKNLANYSRSLVVQQNSTHQPLIDPEAPKEIHRAKASILSNAARVRTLVCGPTDFLKHLASQIELLACLRWLGEFQILACIPLVGCVPIKDVADLSGVPEAQLGRVIRLTATAGFLRELQIGRVAHTSLSAPFVANPAFLDAAMFLAESAAPSALHMAPATQSFAGSHRPHESAWSLALNTSKPFHTARAERPKLNRQWSAYLHYAAGLHTVEEVADMLSQLSWSRLSNACIVEMGAQSTSMAQCLVDLYAGLRIVVQIGDTSSATPNLDWPASSSNRPRAGAAARARASETEPSSARITVTKRAAGARQPVTDAAVYILHLPTASSPGHAAVLSQLQEHLGVLRANGSVMLVLTACLLPEPGSLPDQEVEAVALARNLSMLQLANEGEMEMAELLDMIETVRDSVGKLVVTDRLRSRDGLIVALAVKHQAYTDASAEF